MLDYMKTSQVAAFYLGIIFAVLTIATSLLAFKYAKKLNSFVKALAMCLITPFISCTAWLYLVFSYVEVLRKSEILTLVVAILLSLFICAMVVIVAKALYNKHGVALEEYDAYMEAHADDPVTETTEENQVENEKAEENSEAGVPAVVAAPLLLNGTENEIIVDAEAEEVEAETQEEVAQAEENEQTEAVEVAEESEVAPETEEAEETTETEESPVEENDASDEETDDDDDDEEGDPDEEFNKFLEELRRKVEDGEDNNGEGEGDNN